MNKTRLVTDDAVILRRQRDQAVAAACLCAIILAALLLATFGPQSSELKVAEQGVRIHRELITEHRRLLKDVESVLELNRAALDRGRQAPPPNQ